MSTRDFMIGDWVYNAHHKRNIRITPRFFHSHDSITGEQYLPETAKPSFGRDLIPIPLTPEILEKNGFHSYGEAWYLPTNNESHGIHVSVGFHRHETVMDIYQRKVFSFYRVYNNDTPYENTSFFVHELQHALCLCGIDKEIIL